MSSPRRVVLLSAFHDYRTAKRGSIQQVADGLVRLGHQVTFVSTRFSRLSRLSGDSRLPLWDRANRVETVKGVQCYLARTLAHPFQSSNPVLNSAMAFLYRFYAELPDGRFDSFMREADDVIVESSIAAIYLRRIRRLNPNARIIYYATDRLDTVGAHPFVLRRLEQDRALIHHVSIRSPKMASVFDWAADRLFRAEFGIDPAPYAAIGPSPYPLGTTSVVSVGSMLFDPTFVQLAATAFPEVAFHVIGCGTEFDAPANVTVHPEMPFADTLPFVKHATLGAAPYRAAPGAEYLVDSSLKIAQYEYFGLPVVCPKFAAGETGGRFGYEPGDAASIVAALQGAFAAVGTLAPKRFLAWEQVAARILDPLDFADTSLDRREDDHGGGRMGHSAEPALIIARA